MKHPFLKKLKLFIWFSFESSNLVFPLRVKLLSLVDGSFSFLSCRWNSDFEIYIRVMEMQNSTGSLPIVNVFIK